MPDDANDTPDDGARPVDYFNPHARPEPTGATEPPAPPPAAVVPAEFDAALTRSNDHAGVAAVETALTAMRIPFHRAAGAEIGGREIALFVRAADLDKASVAAARIFARRARVKAMNKPRPADPDPDGPFFGIDPLP